MKIWSGLLNIFAILLIAMLFIIFHNIYSTNERQFEEVRLQYASDYATMAALNNAFRAASTHETNYEDLSAVLISPEKINDVYNNVLSLSYKFSEDSFTEGLLDNSIVAAVICESWGYRLLEEVQYDSNLDDKVPASDFKYQWGVLRPYIVNKNGRVFAANICNDSTKEYLSYGAWTTLADSEGGNNPDAYRIYSREDYTDTGLTKGDVKLAIALLLNEDINNMISKRVYSGAYGDIQGLYISVDDSLSAVNSIERPTLLMVVQHSSLINEGDKSSSYTLSGAAVIPKTSVVGFEFLQDMPGLGKKGTRYYCYAGQYIDSSGNLLISQGGSSKIKILETFDTIEEASQAGYHPHMVFLENPKRPTGGN